MSGIEAWATQQFEALTLKLLERGFKLDGSGVIRDQDPPGERRIQVTLLPHVSEPSIRVLNQGKPNPAPSVTEEEDPEEPAWVRHDFDAQLINSEYGWLEQSGSDGLITTEALAQRIRDLFTTM